MEFIFGLIVVGVLLNFVFQSFERRRQLNEKVENDLMNNLDEDAKRKQLYNESQQPGELDNSVEVFRK